MRIEKEKTILVSVKISNGYKQIAINPDLIEYTKLSLGECQINLVMGENTKVREEHEEITRRIRELKGKVEQLNKEFTEKLKVKK